MQHLWEKLERQILSKSPQQDPHGGESLFLPHVWKTLPIQTRLEGSRQDPHERKTFQLSSLRGDVSSEQQPDQPPEETPGAHAAAEQPGPQVTAVRGRSPHVCHRKSIFGR